MMQFLIESDIFCRQTIILDHDYLAFRYLDLFGDSLFNAHEKGLISNAYFFKFVKVFNRDPHILENLGP